MREDEGDPLSRLPRPCVGARDPVTRVKEECGVPVTGTSRCDRHQRMNDAWRPSPSSRGYDREYQKEREEALAPVDGEPVRCQLRLEGCTGLADTLHHVVPVDAGRNVAAARRGPKIPACGHCNYALGKRPLDEGRPRPVIVGRGLRGDEDGDDWFPEP